MTNVIITDWVMCYNMLIFQCKPVKTWTYNTLDSDQPAWTWGFVPPEVLISSMPLHLRSALSTSSSQALRDSKKSLMLHWEKLPQWLATTAFHQMRNFKPSHQLRNLPVSVEFLSFHGILRNSVQPVIYGTNMEYFGQVQSYDFTMGEYWKYWAELIRNIASLFDRNTDHICQWQ